MTASFFFFNDTATTEIYTLSLHDALPICLLHGAARGGRGGPGGRGGGGRSGQQRRRRLALLDRKSTRLNSSHSQNSDAVFCLEKKNKRNCANSTISHLRE